MRLPSLHRLGKTEEKDQMGELFSTLDEINRLQLQEHQEEIKRIKNRMPSNYPKTIYVYSEEEIPAGYVKHEKSMGSIFLLRKYARRVFRNIKKKIYVIPEVEEIGGKGYVSYTTYGPTPEAGEPVIPITRKR